MKLLFITNGINEAGGLERVLAIKASYFAEKLGYEVHIITLEIPKPFYSFSDKVIFHNIKFNGNPLNYILSYVKGIKNIIRKFQPDIISICDDGLKAFLLPIFLGKNIPLIYERHASKAIEMNQDFSFFKKSLVRLKWNVMSVLAKKFDAFVVLTNGNIKEWKNLNNLHVIPNPVSFYPSTSSNLNSKRVIAIGRHDYQKGYDLLLKVWAEVTKEVFDWHLEIYGKIKPELGLMELATQLGIEQNVHFYSPTENIDDKLLQSSIFVLSSRSEGFGMVLVEAMACGLPCISFDCPSGPADIINNGNDGFLIANGDVIAMANSLKKLMNNDDLRKKMGAAAKINVQRYLPEEIICKWECLFGELERRNIND